MSVTASIKRGFLRRAYAAVTETHTLEDELTDQLTASLNRIANGVSLSSTSANGHAATFNTPGKGAPAADSIAEMWSELLELYETVKADLGTSTESTIYAAMLVHDAMQGTSVVYADHSNTVSDAPA